MSTTEGPMSFRPYREAVESGEFVPTPYSLEVDQILRDIKAEGREANPEYWTNLGMYGWTFFHPLQKDNSLTEYTSWVNRGLGSSYFGGGSEAPAANTAGTNTVDNNYFSESDVRALYQEILGRQPGADGLNYWLERSGTMTMDELRYNIENSPEALGQTNNTTGNEDPAGGANFTEADVYALYNEILGRDPRADGLNYWMARATTMSLADLRWNIENSPEALGNTDGSGDTDTDTDTDGDGTDTGNDSPIGWYWANAGGGWQWFPFYMGEGPPANAGYVSNTADSPTGPPAGWTDPNGNNNTDPEPEPETLYTPDESMFFNGMFTAQDILGRDGGEIQSPYYSNARQNVLDQLAVQAAENGRTQNTKQEIQVAQQGAPGLTANGLFNPDYLALVRGMGLGGR